MTMSPLRYFLALHGYCIAIKELRVAISGYPRYVKHIASEVYLAHDPQLRQMPESVGSLLGSPVRARGFLSAPIRPRQDTGASDGASDKIARRFGILRHDQELLLQRSDSRSALHMHMCT